MVFLQFQKINSGGSTPKNRIIGKGNKNWITPSIISKYGFLITEEKITCEQNNIKRDCALIVNRTSKEGSGGFVGISIFYDYSLNGIAQCNQGLYKISEFQKEDLLFITSMLNSFVYRNIFKYLSIGSKMDEVKIYQLTKLPFPKFPDNIKKVLLIFITT